ncbi:MAG: ribosome biogenesis factor YjgA [Reinekea sp.]|jgi:ribosome-associated protein
MNEFDDAYDDDDIEWVSKSEIKREMHRLQAIGKQLLTLKASDLKRFALSDELHAALAESKRIKSNEATRRHLQYIGKLMRSEDIDSICQELDRLDPSSDLSQRILKQSEQWRDRLISENDAEQDWFNQYPQTDRQHFRALVRGARKEQPNDTDGPLHAGKNTKKLLQWIKSQLAGQ